MAEEEHYSDAELKAGIAASRLIAHPATWINRRVETIELLANEETRRRVSIDFTLRAEQQEDLKTPDGIVVPISVLSKEARRNFDLRDESGAAVPVLGKKSNGALAHIAVMDAALDVLPNDLTADAFELLWSELRQVVVAPRDHADEALGVFAGHSESGDNLRSKIWQNEDCQSLLKVLQENYVLFAVLPPGGPNRRVLKYSYGEDFDWEIAGSLQERVSPSSLWQRVWLPDRIHFTVECPAAWRASSFHAEIVIPEELRIEAAVLIDDEEKPVSDPDLNRNRASLYANWTVESANPADVFVVVAPERRGRTIQAAATALVVTCLLWLGVYSRLDAKEPDAAVSLLLAGAALYSGITAVGGEHVLVTKLFSASRRWLAIIGISALVASAALAMQVPNAHPVGVWRSAGFVGIIASLRLAWSAIRAPG
jgi:hypothetical protein